MVDVAEAYVYKKLPIKQNGQPFPKQFRLQSPASLVEISYPKMGKTLSMVNVPKIIICDAHREVDDFRYCYNYMKIATYTGKNKFYQITSGAYIPAGIYEAVMDLKHANSMGEYWKLKNMLDELRPEEEKEAIFNELIVLINSMRYPISAWDTVTHMQDLNNAAALAEYNSQVSTDKRKSDIRKVDKWGGVRYIRNNFAGIKQFIEDNASPFQIWTSHVKERKAVYEKTDQELSVVDMALEGLASNIFTASASAIAILYRKKDGVYLDFRKRDESDLGSRCAHLADEVIKIADPRPDKNTIPKTYWERIYPELTFN
jgi:hypothetical protein